MEFTEFAVGFALAALFSAATILVVMILGLLKAWAGSPQGSRLPDWARSSLPNAFEYRELTPQLTGDPLPAMSFVVGAVLVVYALGFWPSTSLTFFVGQTCLLLGVAYAVGKHRLLWLRAPFL